MSIDANTTRSVHLAANEVTQIDNVTMIENHSGYTVWYDDVPLSADNPGMRIEPSGTRVLSRPKTIYVKSNIGGTVYVRPDMP